MSRIGNSPIVIPAGCTVEDQNGTVRIKGPKGELEQGYRTDLVKLEREEDKLMVRTLVPQEKAYHGMIRKLIFNMVQGVSTGFSKGLQISGVGYKAQVQGEKLVLNIGFNHPYEVAIPGGLKVDIKDGTMLTVLGSDKELVGRFAAQIRKIRRVEPYLGKGIKYSDEIVKRKVGKTGA